MFVCHEISAHAQKLEFLMTLLISFVLIKILEFFDAVKNNRRNEVRFFFTYLIGLQI